VETRGVSGPPGDARQLARGTQLERLALFAARDLLGAADAFSMSLASAPDATISSPRRVSAKPAIATRTRLEAQVTIKTRAHDARREFSAACRRLWWLTAQLGATSTESPAASPRRERPP
jgi:hypothetical protein